MGAAHTVKHANSRDKRAQTIVEASHQDHLEPGGFSYWGSAGDPGPSARCAI